MEDSNVTSGLDHSELKNCAVVTHKWDSEWQIEIWAKETPVFMTHHLSVTFKTGHAGEDLRTCKIIHWIKIIVILDFDVHKRSPIVKFSVKLLLKKYFEGREDASDGMISNIPWLTTINHITDASLHRGKDTFILEGIYWPVSADCNSCLRNFTFIYFLCFFPILTGILPTKWAWRSYI